MKTQHEWPPAWQASNGASIVDFVLNEARKRGLTADEIAAPDEPDTRCKNQVMIEGRRCQVLPGRVLDPDEADGKEALRLHPAFGWDSDFLIYVVSGSAVFVLPATNDTVGGAWAISVKVIERYKDDWRSLYPLPAKRRA